MDDYQLIRSSDPQKINTWKRNSENGLPLDGKQKKRRRSMVHDREKMADNQRSVASRMEFVLVPETW